MELWKFEDEKVRIRCTDGDVLEGVVGDYIWEDDNEKYGCDGIFLYRNGNYDDTILVNSNEIKSIEIIPYFLRRKRNICKRRYCFRISNRRKFPR